MLRLLTLVVLLATASPAFACPPAHYPNSAGECVARPTWPQGAKAVCRDGYVTYSRNFRGICSRHGGVYRRAK